MTSSRPVSPAYDIPTSAHSVQARLQAGGLDLSLFENRSRTSTAPALYAGQRGLQRGGVQREPPARGLGKLHTDDRARHEHLHADAQPPRTGSGVRLLERLQQHGEELQVRLRIDDEGGAAAVVEADAVDRDDDRRHIRALLCDSAGRRLERAHRVARRAGHDSRHEHPGRVREAAVRQHRRVRTDAVHPDGPA